MSKKISLIFFTLAMVLYGSQSLALDLYFGAKTGTMMVDVPGVGTDPKNGSVVLGYELGLVVADLAVEAELSRTMDEGTFGSAPLEVDTNAVYVAVRTGGPIYFKARGGYIDTTYSIASFDGSDSGMSYGIGMGLGLGLLQVEVEYTLIDDDTQYVTLGVQF